MDTDKNCLPFKVPTHWASFDRRWATMKKGFAPQDGEYSYGQPIEGAICRGTTVPVRFPTATPRVPNSNPKSTPPKTKPNESRMAFPVSGTR